MIRVHRYYSSFLVHNSTNQGRKERDNMVNSAEKEYHLLTTDQILVQMQQWENRADTLYDELVARVRSETRTPFYELAHDELLAESEIAQQEWQDLQQEWQDLQN